MTDIHIPPEALEKGARKLYSLRIGGDPSISWEQAAPSVQNSCRNRVAVAFRAIVEGWPGMKEEWRDNINMLTGAPIRYPVIVLPLEASNG